MLLGVRNKAKETDSNLEWKGQRYKSLREERFERKETARFLERTKIIDSITSTDLDGGGQRPGRGLVGLPLGSGELGPLGLVCFFF